MSETFQCPLCRATDAIRIGWDNGWEYKCDTCGTFALDSLAESHVEQGSLARGSYLVSAATRQASDAGAVLKLDLAKIKDIVERGRPYAGPLELADKILLDIANQVPKVGRAVQWSLRDYPRYAVHDKDEFLAIVRLLTDQGFVSMKADEANLVLEPTVEGWRRAGELRVTAPRSDQAFVAMRFLHEMGSTYDAIRAALEAAGYRALRIDLEEHNEMIVDRIIAEIRRSVLLVAELTHHANGVYFEAGFAKGLGLPVVWCCRADEFEKRHFDVQQFNTIVWKTESELQERLYERVRATAPIRGTAP